MIEIKNTGTEYIEEAVKLAEKEYKTECGKCGQLLNADFHDELRGIISYLFSKNLGRVALQDGKFAGYIAFNGPFDGFFGNVKGVFSPLGGSAFDGNDRGKIASMLFEQIGSELAEKGICCYGLSRYAHDTEAGTSFVLNGFGIRCSDAVMRLADRNIPLPENSEVEVRELNGQERIVLEELHHGLIRHMASAPIFFPTSGEYLQEGLMDEGKRFFGAFVKDRPVGYISFTEEAETFITERPEMLNICGAFVTPEYRGSHTAEIILEHICRVCEQEGRTYLGVDCETLNPTALRFWGKYFQNYTYSYVRRLDERIVGYNSYLDRIWSK